MGDGYVLPGRGATAGFAVAATQQLACSRHWPSPGPSGSGKPDRFDRLLKKPLKFKFQTKNGSSIGFHRLADRLDRLPVGLSGNRQNSFFLFKFKCPQNILNECLYNMF